MGMLLRMVWQLLESVISQIAQQISTVQEAALAPIQAMVQQVLGGIWIGEGATAFVEEVTSLLIPDVTRIAEDLTQHNTNLGSARDIVDQADEQVESLVNSRLSESFGFF